jgi:hypothetical protein
MIGELIVAAWGLLGLVVIWKLREPRGKQAAARTSLAAAAA